MESILKTTETEFITLDDLKYNRENVILIESSDSNNEILTSAFEDIDNSDVIGLDSEWVKSTPIKTIIFQIATRDKAFVFDFNPAKGENDLFNTNFQIKLNKTFLNEKIIKIAWDFDLDLKNLNNKFSNKNIKLNEIRSTVDLMRFAPKFIEKGFSNHCLYYLGKKLDKTCQVCPWDERPLTEERIVYAALDAVAAIPLYEKMSKKIKMEPNKLDLEAVHRRMKEYRDAKKNVWTFKSEWEVAKII